MISPLQPRASQPFVPVDCAPIAPSLLESELFGAMRGAFTGADRDRVGVFEAANRGTVFLDEIGEIEMNFQVALLRFLEGHEIRPVGASRSKEVDVRVIAATNRDLQRLVDEKKFREDLWYRLNTVRIVLPPLRERRSDIPLLARFYRQQVQRALQPRREADGFRRQGAAGLHLARQRAPVAARHRAPDHSGRPRRFRRRARTP
jgi:transcriptional regulator with GAF, ATPase, and Fis domain